MHVRSAKLKEAGSNPLKVQTKSYRCKGIAGPYATIYICLMLCYALPCLGLSHCIEGSVVQLG